MLDTRCFYIYILTNLQETKTFLVHGRLRKLKAAYNVTIRCFAKLSMTSKRVITGRNSRHNNQSNHYSIQTIGMANKKTGDSTSAPV